jgi:hypothetical protein
MCNCKQKPASPKIKYESVGEINVISNQVITFTQEDIDRARNYIITHNEEQREWFISFTMEHFKEQIVGYCDTVCRKVMSEKLDKLQQRLI